MYEATEANREGFCTQKCKKKKPKNAQTKKPKNKPKKPSLKLRGKRRVYLEPKKRKLQGIRRELELPFQQALTWGLGPWPPPAPNVRPEWPFQYSHKPFWHERMADRLERIWINTGGAVCSQCWPCASFGALFQHFPCWTLHLSAPVLSCLLLDGPQEWLCDL